MPRYKLTLEYEGTRYKGWQLQKNVRTVQGAIMDVCRNVLQTETFELQGAGRTDAGVHALGQVAHLDLKEASLTPETLLARLNDQLPHDINILSLEEADARFHARHHAVARSYVYHLSTRRTALAKPYVWWVKNVLDVVAMQQAAASLQGFHNFASFTEDSPEDKSTTVELLECSVQAHGALLDVHVVGSHFLWKMVRRMVGVLVEIGRGNMPVEQAADFLKTYSRAPAKLTAPSSGLFLDKIYYDKKELGSARKEAEAAQNMLFRF